MMTAALYEMLCQSYTYVNSMAYRTATGETGRAARSARSRSRFPAA